MVLEGLQAGVGGGGGLLYLAARDRAGYDG